MLLRLERVRGRGSGGVARHGVGADPCCRAGVVTTRPPAMAAAAPRGRAPSPVGRAGAGVKGRRRRRPARRRCSPVTVTLKGWPNAAPGRAAWACPRRAANVNPWLSKAPMSARRRRGGAALVGGTPPVDRGRCRRRSPGCRARAARCRLGRRGLPSAGRACAGLADDVSRGPAAHCRGAAPTRLSRRAA